MPIQLRTAVFPLLTLLIASAIYATFPETTVLYPDSAAYARFDPIVTATYPIWFRLIGVGGLPLAQLALFATCAAVLVTVVYRELRSALVSGALLITLFINPEMNRFHTTAISESLFLSVDLLFIAATTLFVTRREVKWAAAAAALAAVAVTIRPIAAPLVGALILIIPLVLKDRGWRTIAGCAALCVLAWLTIVGAERLYSHARHGSAQTSLTGPHLYAKSVLIDAPPVDPSTLTPLERRYAFAAEVEYAPVRDLLDRAEGTPASAALRGFYQVCIQHGCSDPIRAKAGVTRAVANQAMLRVALARISAAPGAYLGLAAEEYKLLWALNTRTHPHFAPKYDSFVQSARPLPLEAQLNQSVVAKTAPSKLAFVLRPSFIAAGIIIGVLTLYFLLATLRRAPLGPIWSLSLFSALCVQLVFVFTALVGLPEGRYTMGMWPHIATALLFLVGGILEMLLKGRVNSGFRRPPAIEKASAA